MFVTDMDGTFLPVHNHFDEERLRALLEIFKEKNYLFVAASGRPLLNLEKLFAEFRDQVAFVAENGSIVTYQGQTIFEDKPLKRKDYLAVIKGIETGPYGSAKHVVLSGRSGGYYLEGQTAERVARIEEIYVHAVPVADFSLVKEPIAKMVAAFPEEKLEEAQAWLNARFPKVTALATGLNSVDIVLSDMNKAVGLEKLCQHLGVEAEDVIAFGDNENDVEMLEFAGLSIAPANARETVKAVADQIIGPYYEESVVKWMEEVVSSG